MGILSSLLPGVRDFRTPFAVGALWTTAVVLLLWHLNDGDLKRIGFLENVYKIYEQLPDALGLGGLAFTIYLIGIVAKGLQDQVPSLRWWLRAPLARFEPKYTHPAHRSKLGRLATNNYLSDAARERFADYPPAVRETARSILLEEYDLADVILTSKSPEQYQEYDRWRSEAEFRTGIWIPLLLVGFSLGLLANGAAAWLIPTGVGAISLLLRLQGLERRQRADQRLASAVYFNLASTPLFDSLLSEMGRKAAEYAPGGRNVRSNDPQQISWALDFLRRRGRDRLMADLLLYDLSRFALRSVLDEVHPETLDYIRSSSSLGQFLLVAYGGAEWGNDFKSIADAEVRVDRTLAANDRLRTYLEQSYDNGDFQADDLAVGGALSHIDDSDIPRLRGSASEREWRMAVRIEDSRNSRHAKFPETAFEPN